MRRQTLVTPLLAALSIAAAVIAADTPSPAEWIKLFADEDWYKGQAAPEEVFSGKLEAVQPPQASTLQRNSLYKLGNRTLYTGAKKMPALDVLVGKEVEIRGKGVEMSLEGRELFEIWPASVRKAAAVPTPPSKSGTSSNAPPEKKTSEK